MNTFEVRLGSGIAHACVGCNFGVLYSGNSDGWTAAHELGHILGLQDTEGIQYNGPDSATGLYNGANIMSAHFGRPSEDDIGFLRDKYERRGFQ